MSDQRVNGHTVSRLTVDIVWGTNYRYWVLEGDIQKKCRAILIQICDVEGINILKGVVKYRSCSYAYRISSVTGYK